MRSMTARTLYGTLTYLVNELTRKDMKEKLMLAIYPVTREGKYEPGVTGRCRLIPAPRALACRSFFFPSPAATAPLSSSFCCWLYR